MLEPEKVFAHRRSAAEAQPRRMEDSGWRMAGLSVGVMLWALVVLAGGCTTGPSERGARVADIENEEMARTPAAPVAPQPQPEAATVPVAPEPSPAVVQTAEGWVSLPAWCRANGWAAPYVVGPAPSPSYAVSTSGGGLMLRVGSSSAYWDGVEVRLGFVPQLINGQPCVQALEVRKTFEPLVRSAFAVVPRVSGTIVIDPGHGGTDAGARSVLGRGYEKEYTLDWARRLGARLAAAGWRVFLTRDRDVELSLPNRVAVAEAQKADVFVSLHFNSAAPDEREAGLETYCLTPTGMPSSVTRGYGDDLAAVYPNNGFDEQNLQLALRVHRMLLEVNGRMDRGVRRARYLGVLRGQNRPAILVEGGYLSNRREARWIADGAYREKLAGAVALALE